MDTGIDMTARSGDRRTRARELAMQALYQLDVQGEEFLESDSLARFLRENSDDEKVYNLAEQWSRGAWNNLVMCDRLIVEAAIRWELSRLSSVDRSILRLSVYQLRYCDDIPGKVVINEAIEIAKKYSDRESPRFVNGVLDAVLKRLQSGQRPQGCEVNG